MTARKRLIGSIGNYSPKQVDNTYLTGFSQRSGDEFFKFGVSSFTIPPAVITGIGAAEQVGEQAKRLGGEKALVVTDPGISKLGYADGTVKQLNAVGIDASIFENVTPDPNAAKRQ